jgi:hypothetical protein
MKLAEIKSSIIESFFTEDSAGVPQDQLDPVFESIGKTVGLDLNSEKLALLSQSSNQSSDPSKAFKRFTEGRVAILAIIEEDGMVQNAIFAAVRSGMNTKVSDLTNAAINEKNGGLADVKSALRQAKDRNEDVIFNIITTDKL